VCSQCSHAYYCSPEHQNQDWAAFHAYYCSALKDDSSEDMQPLQQCAHLRVQAVELSRLGEVREAAKKELQVRLRVPLFASGGAQIGVCGVWGKWCGGGGRRGGGGGGGGGGGCSTSSSGDRGSVAIVYPPPPPQPNPQP
jgi:hypothetical protein